MTSCIRLVQAQAVNAGTPPVDQDIVASSGPYSDRQPVAALYQTSGCTSTNSPLANSRYGLGITDGTTQRAYGVSQEDGANSGNADAQTRHDTATVIQMPQSTSSALAGEAAWSSWQNGGSRITWADLLEDRIINALYFFDCEAKVVDFAGSSTLNGTASVTGLPFVPDMVVSISHFNAFAADTGTDDFRSCLGFAVKTPAGAIQQVCHTKFCNDQNALATSHAAALHDNAIVAAVDQASDGPLLELTAWNSDGADITTRRAAISISTALLFLRTRRKLWAGIPSLVTSSTGVKAITDPGFRAASYLCLATRLATKNTTSRVAAGDGWTHGGFSGFTAEEFFVGGYEADAAAASVSRAHASFNVASPILVAATPTYSWIANHESLDPNGFSINVGDASLTDELAAFVAIGDVRDGWLPEIVRRRHRSVVWGPRGK